MCRKIRSSRTGERHSRPAPAKMGGGIVGEQADQKTAAEPLQGEVQQGENPLILKNFGQDWTQKFKENLGQRNAVCKAGIIAKGIGDQLGIGQREEVVGAR